ncbi:hypothetical protein [Pseudomonas aeruginosa]|uniref:hypothetical protein n=1 Tax=Pseudomonas aeruginosa TaxID=287 RepID=UPI002458D14C|nr:hypothetical protein [Pseudomonas aeruginosa]MDH4704185.1 hypothetical protein [Pseudomonas aeruginosa]
MITVTYHVTVTVPVLVWQHFRESGEYYQAMCTAFAGNTGAGTNYYSAVEEWADFDSAHAAQRAEQKALVVIAEYERRAQTLEAERLAEIAAQEENTHG